MQNRGALGRLWERLSEAAPAGAAARPDLCAPLDWRPPAAWTGGPAAG